MTRSRHHRLQDLKWGIQWCLDRGVAEGQKGILYNCLTILDGLIESEERLSTALREVVGLDDN